MKTMREYFDTFICINPAVLILLGLLNGVIPFFLLAEIHWLGAFITPVALIVILAVLLKISGSDVWGRAVAKFAIFSILGWGLALSASKPLDDNYSSLLPCSECGAEIKVRFIDTTDLGSKIDWLPQPRSVMVEVLALRTSQKRKWQQASGKLMINFPKRRVNSTSVDTLHSLDYGRTATLKGAFIEPAQPLFKGDFDYELYLETRGISKIYYVSSLQADDSPIPLSVKMMQKILYIRNMILIRMTDGMSVANKKILAALMFGCRYGLNYGIRRTFLESGVIHVFAISGLHVGILALALFILLRWLPFRLRYMIVPFILFFYVITTGMHASALRALLMLSVWSFIKAFLYRTSSLNIVCVAASILLILNPLSLFDAGFQFSFVIAGFLVFAWGTVNEWLQLLNEHNLWVPSHAVKMRHKIVMEFKKFAFNSLITSAIAWMAGSIVLMIHRSLFIPGALFTNFLIIPFVWILSVFAVIDLFCLPFFSIHYILELLLNIIRSITGAGAELGGAMNVLSPPWYINLIFFAALLLFMSARKKAVFIGAGLTLFLCLSSVFILKSFQKEQITIFHGGDSQYPAVVIIPPEGEIGVTVINPGTSERTKSILTYLVRNGVNSIDYLLFSESRKSCSEGAWMILGGINVRHTIFPPDVKRSRYAKFAMQHAFKDGSYVSISRKILSGVMTSSYKSTSIEFSRRKKSDYSFFLKTGAWNVEIIRTLIMPGERTLQIQSPENSKIVHLLNASKLELY